jgi:hypothetical protein
MRTWLDPIATRSIVPSCKSLILRVRDVLMRDKNQFRETQFLPVSGYRRAQRDAPALRM